MTELYWTSDDYKAAKKALQVLAVIETLCGDAGQYVDKEILEDIVRDMEAKDGKSIDSEKEEAK